ncbi:MAG: hypothetical protein GXO75_13590 [Calditrichaeota bacterium]|nr:hypothetical protein [Calditrichota bacterium]
MTKSRYEKAHWGTILNAWFAFNVLMVFLSRFPHIPMPLMSWINLSLYFLAFLITFFLVKEDQFNRDIYLPFCILFLINSSILLYIFIGDNYLIGNNEIGWSIYKHTKLILAFFFVYSIVYYSAKHSLRPQNPFLLITATIALVTAIFIFHFKDFLFDPSSFYDKSLDRKLFLFHLFPPVAIVLYGLLSPLFKPKYGIYYHSIMVVLLFLSARQIFIDLVKLKNISIFGIDQIFLTIALLFLLYFLAQKLNFISTLTGQISNLFSNYVRFIAYSKFKIRNQRS